MSDNNKNNVDILNIFCSHCGAPAQYDIETQEYHCRYCGSPTGIREALAEKRRFRKLRRESFLAEKPSFPVCSGSCTGCGAKIFFPESDALTTCSFCGRSLVRKEYLNSDDFPELVIPFRITPEDAKNRLLAWCENNERRREAKAIKKEIGSLSGCYLPYQLVKGPTFCRVMRKEAGRKYECRGYLDGSFVNTSKNLNNLLLDGTEPFDLADIRDFDFSYLAGQRVKITDLSDSETEARVCDEIAADYEPVLSKVLESRAVTVETDADGLLSMSVVLPVYYLNANGVLAAVNGQTGKVAVQEAKDRFTLPWQLRPIAAFIITVAVVFGFTQLFRADMTASLMITGMLAVFFLIVIFVAYDNHYAGTGRTRLRRRIFTSDSNAAAVSPPVFYEKINGKETTVRMRFSTPGRILRMGFVALLVTFLPLVIAFVLNGFSIHGIKLGGAAVWLCIFVPVTPIYFLNFGRLEIYNKPMLYYRNKKGRERRYVKKPDLNALWGSIKDVLSPVAVIIALVALGILAINVYLCLHWDSV